MLLESPNIHKQIYTKIKKIPYFKRILKEKHFVLERRQFKNLFNISQNQNTKKITCQSEY